MSSWLQVTPAQAAGVILGFAVLALAMPREDGFLIPEKRDWLGFLRRMNPRARRRAEATGELEAISYVAALHGQPSLNLTVNDLPSMHRTIPTTLLTDEAPPWDTAARPGTKPAVLPAARQTAPRKRGGDPTIVSEVLRPGISRDLGMYLTSLPGYQEKSPGS